MAPKSGTTKCSNTATWFAFSKSTSWERKPRIKPLRALRRLAAAVFAAVFITRVAFVAGGETSFSLFDDAMISMRHAANLAEGHGLVCNAGETPVEGYTNLLWTLWMAL